MKKFFLLFSSLICVDQGASACALEDFIPKTKKEIKNEKKSITREFYHKRSLENFESLDLQPGEHISYFPASDVIEEEYGKRCKAMPKEFKKLRENEQLLAKYSVPNETGLYVESVINGMPLELFETINPENYEAYGTCMHLSYMGLTYKIWVRYFGNYTQLLKSAQIRLDTGNPWRNEGWMYAYKTPPGGSTCVIERQPVFMGFDYHSPGHIRIWPIIPHQGTIRVHKFHLEAALEGREFVDYSKDYPQLAGGSFYGTILKRKDEYLIEDFPIISKKVDI